MLGHAHIKTCAVNRQAVDPQRIFGEVIRKSVSIIEFECDVARQYVSGAHTRRRFVEQLQAILKRAAELSFLLHQSRFNRGLRADKLRIGPAHFSNQCGHKAVHQRLLRTQQMRMPHGAAHDPAEDIAATFIGGKNTVSH